MDRVLSDVNATEGKEEERYELIVINELINIAQRLRWADPSWWYIFLVEKTLEL